MSGIDLSRELLKKAEQDLQALKELEFNQKVADEIYGFLAQQAAEKALKAWLSAKQVIFDFTHDLSRLLAELQEQGEEVGDLVDLVDLNPFAVQFRYESIAFGAMAAAGSPII